MYRIEAYVPVEGQWPEYWHPLTSDDLTLAEAQRQMDDWRKHDSQYGEPHTYRAVCVG